MRLLRRELLKRLAASVALSCIGGPVLGAVGGNTVDKWVKGVCRYCGTGCGVLVGVRDGKAVSIKGDPNNHNQGLLCLKGAMLIPVIYTPDRITEPMIRRGGKQSPFEKSVGTKP